MKLIFFTFILTTGVSAFSKNLVSYKDKAFSHGQVLDQSKNFWVIDYNEQRDVNGRDEIPVDKALNERVTLLSNETSTRVNGLSLYMVGSPKTDNFIVIFIHGAGGNKELGFNDWSFGGNFNRLKNLAVRNKGSYLSPSVKFNTSGMNKVGQLIKTLKSNNPSLQIILSCASQGGSVCWHLAKDQTVSSYLSGMVFLGTAVNMPSESLAFIQQKKPIIFAHGSSDPILHWRHLKNSHSNILKTNSNYPIKYYLYNGGVHGTPIRMIDWKIALDWIL